jgi:hypothetical protein
MQVSRTKKFAPEDRKKADLEADKEMGLLTDRLRGADLSAIEAARVELERNYVDSCMAIEDGGACYHSLFNKRHDERLLRLFEAWQAQLALRAAND